MRNCSKNNNPQNGRYSAESPKGILACGVPRRIFPTRLSPSRNVKPVTDKRWSRVGHSYVPVNSVHCKYIFEPWYVKNIGIYQTWLLLSYLDQWHSENSNQIANYKRFAKMPTMPAGYSTRLCATIWVLYTETCCKSKGTYCMNTFRKQKTNFLFCWGVRCEIVAFRKRLGQKPFLLTTIKSVCTLLCD